MGDRTYCHLQILGGIRASDWETLKAVCSQYADDQGDEDAGQFIMPEMNFGKMPQDLKDALQEAGVSFLWSWDNGASFTEGAAYFDAVEFDSVEEFCTEFPTVDGRIVVELNRVTDEDYIKAARIVQAAFDSPTEFKVLADAPVAAPVASFRFVVSKAELDTILAALRFWQRVVVPVHGDELPELLLAEDSGNKLSVTEIDALCARIN